MRYNNVEMVKLSDVADLTVGYVGTMGKEYSDSGVTFLRSLNIKPFSFDLNDLKYIPEGFHQKLSKSALHKDDVVIVRTGIPGTCAVIPDELEGSNCADLVIVRPDLERVDPYYLCAFINSWGKAQVSNSKVGAVQKHFNVTSAEEMLIPLPELSVQRTIGMFIQNLNAKIENNTSISSTLESLAKIIYDYWFVQFDFPDEKGKPYKSSGGKMVWNEDLKKEIPEKWEVKPLGDILSFSKGRIPDELSDIPKGNLNSPYITIDVANNGLPQYCDPKSMVRCNGEVIMVMDGAASGDIYLGNEGSLGSTFSMLPSKREDISDGLIYMMLTENAVIYKRANTGSTVPHANRSFIEKMIVAMPKDASYFSGQFSVLFKKVIGVKEENRYLASLRDYLLPMLMNGQVKVNA